MMTKIPSSKFSTVEKKIAASKFSTVKRKLPSGVLGSRTAKIPARKLAKAIDVAKHDVAVPTPLGHPTDESNRQKTVAILKSQINDLKTSSKRTAR